MGFFKKIIDKIKSKKKLSEKIKEKNVENKQIINITKQSTQKEFDKGLKKSSKFLEKVVNEIAINYREIDENFIEKLEEMLIMYDIGITSTNKIIDSIQKEIKYQGVKNPDLIKEIILDKILTYYIQETEVEINLNIKENRTNVILVSGVNGSGKTTTIAKLAYKFKNEGKKVILVAGDTFRAGAIEQLNIWAEKINVEIISPEKYGQDPASVIFKGVKLATEKKYDIVICDTSGRLQNKNNLMEELKKIKNVITRFEPTAPHENLLVIDATTGQSGLNQAKVFKDISDITGIVLTKMDGTSKGGIILAIKDFFNIPVKFIGLGEKLDDLAVFDLEKYISGLIQGMDIN